MVNMTHLKVLLSKDFMTLKRNIGFVAAFVILPVGLMVAFIEIQGLVYDGEKEGSLIADHFKYINTEFMDYGPKLGILPAPFAQAVLPGDPVTGQVFASSLQHCTQQNPGRYWFSKIGIVAEDAAVRADAVNFFQDYVFFQNAFPSNWTAEGFETQDDLFADYGAIQEQPYCAAVTFKKFDTATNDYEIEFHLGKNEVPDTNQPAYNDLVKAPDFFAWDQWFDHGAVAIYPYITEFIARSKMGADMSDRYQLYNQSMGYAPMSSVKFEDISPRAAQQLTQNFPFFFMIIMLIPFYYLTSKIAAEKESKAREGMKMMGLTDSTYYLSWFIVYSVIALVTCLLLTLTSIWIFTGVNKFLYFWFAFLYQLSLFGWAFAIVAFLPTKRSSSIAATLFHVISYYLVFTIADPSTPASVQYGLSVLPNICMGQIVKQIFFYNLNTRDGLTWSTLHIQYQNYSFRGGICMLLFDLVFWALLGIYLDQIVPSDFGVAKPWNFLCKRKRHNTTGSDEIAEKLLNADLEESEEGNSFEPVSDKLKKQEQEGQCLRVRGLVKKFGQKTAVNGTNLTMYNGQIFALLGHNGAGKTTTISMLTGLLEPTAGFADVFGLDIFKDMAEVRKNLGVCPQHDVLFEFLTPAEHLRLFCSFKGTPKDEIEDQVTKMLVDIDLTTVQNQESRTLSGGQKRKLSVAIAMIGDSKVVMLDEPTSGMDTAARRRLWEMLKKNKAGRIVILTTHYMDEADILGDRIAIMAEGKVQCTGSSLFLKKRYGVGYNLVIAKKSRDPAPHVDKFIMDRILNAKKMQEVSSEISYQLPTSSSQQFKQFFEEFDESLNELGIRSYGVGITTLEEVFLKIGHGIEEGEQKDNTQESITQQAKANINNTTTNTREESEIENYTIEDSERSVFFLHFATLFKKKILMQVRDRKTLAIDTIFPVLLIIIGLALSTISFIKPGPSRLMTPFLYPAPLQMYYNKNSAGITAASGDIDTFMTDSWQGMNVTGINLEGSYTIDTTVPSDILGQVGQLDARVFNLVNESGHAPFYGQFYVNGLNAASAGYSGSLILNSTSQAVVGAWGAFAHEAFLRHYLLANTIDVDNMKVSLVDAPFPVSKALESLNKTISGTNSAILMTIAWMMISDALLQNIIKERQKNIKHQIMVSGSSLLAYWMGNYMADILFQALPAGVALLFVHVFGLDVPDVGYLFLATMLSNPVFIYFFSFFFDKDETGSLVIKMVYFVIGIIAPIAVSVLQVVDETTNNIANIMRWFFYPFPIYSVTYGYMSITQRSIIQLVMRKTEPLAPLSSDVAGLALYFLCGCIPVYWILVICFEMKVFDTLACKKGSNASAGKDRVEVFKAHNTIDEDIVEEQTRIANTDPKNIPVRISEVVKNYGSVKAVRNVSFGLDYGECFAMLGVSGAGKTTIFKCLTGETYPSSGHLTINGYDVSTAFGFSQARKLIGYCPQFDAIFEGLTVKEHLETYAALKGIKSSLRQPMIMRAIADMDLEDYINVRANNLSGGNKRKLSVAIALIGNPPLVFLDEPSTGVDPQAKRFMWNIVSKISTLRKKSAVIITTHSMEEAEALCTKMGIMVNGQFKCFGSSQHIKDKYGTGYEIEIKIRSLTENDTFNMIKEYNLSPDSLDEDACRQLLKDNGNIDLVDELKQNGVGSEYYNQLKHGQKIETGEFLRWQFAEGQGNRAIDHLEKMFKQLQIIEHFGNSWRIKVSRDNYSIGFLFGLMEEIQKQFDISEYSVTQTTLEQIFNNFAMEAEAEEGRARDNTGSLKRRSSKGTSRNSEII